MGRVLPGAGEVASPVAPGVPRRRLGRALWALLVLLAVPHACSRDRAESGRAVLSDLPVHLYDHLDAVDVSGAAAALVGGAAAGEEQLLLEADFEAGRLDPLTPFAGFGVDPDAIGEFAHLIRGEGAFGGGSSAELRGDVDHGASLRTPPIPLDPTQFYRLRYRIALQDVRGASKVESGGVSLLLYRVPPEDAGRVATLLRNPELEQKLRVKPPTDFWTPDRARTETWSTDEVSFRAGLEATHMVLSFDLSRPRDDRAAHRATGRARFDDIQLFARREPFPLRHRELDDGAGDPHALKLSASLGHPARGGASEARYGLAAPAPSTLRFASRLPRSASLYFGYGLLPEVRVPGGLPVVFAVEVTDARGRTHEVFRDELAPDGPNRWSDAEVDLSEYAGQTVRIALRTIGRPAPALPSEALLRLPEGGAVWSYPILSDRSRPGRLIVLVAIDTLPAARSSTYGYERETTPSLSAIADRGTLFLRALSPAPWTLPAFASMLTGLPPARHRAGDVLSGERRWLRPLAPGFVTIVEELRRAGWETRAWINNPILTPYFGLGQGFVSYVDYATQSLDEAAAPAVAELLSQLATPRGYDRFVFFHMMDPHGPYRSNDEFRSRFLSSRYSGAFAEPMSPKTFMELVEGGDVSQADRRRVTEFYESAVAYADDQLGRIFEALQAMEAMEDAADVSLIVVSDHGEELWEHGLFEHGHSMFDELLRVPLVVYAPRRLGAPRRIETPVSTQDVAASLLDLAGIPVPDALESQSFVSPDERAEAAGPRLLTAEHTLYGVQRIAAERDGVKYVYSHQSIAPPSSRANRSGPRHELYLLEPDPGETENRFEAELARALPLHEALAERFVAASDGSYVILLDGGGGPDEEARSHRLEGSLISPVGSLWHASARDFVWPLADGSDAPLRIVQRTTDDKSRMEFEVEAPRALLAFRLKRGEGPIRLQLFLDGRPVAPPQVEVGESCEPPSSMPAELADESLRISAVPLLERRAGAARIVVGRLPETPELRDGRSGDRVDPDLRLQLEALGYTDSD